METLNGMDEVGGSSPAPSHLNEGQGQVVDLGLSALSGAVEIGRGAAGVVYRAEQPSVNRTVAVKMLPYAQMDDAARTRFERETRAMGALSSHPSIVTVYDAGFAPSGQPYIIMELMDGGSLGDRLAQKGRLGWEETVDYGIKVAGALDAAHKKGVLHRDIKPDNILISSYGEPKLADFGIARVHGAQQTQTGLVSATPAHAAPEILRGDPPTEQADVYSLGSTLLMLLYGSPAFVRDTDTSIFPVLARVERDPVPDLRRLDVPDEVCRVLERAMAKDPAHRQQSAVELAAELRSARDAIKGLGTAQIGPAPPPMPGATQMFAPMSPPVVRGATGTQPGVALGAPARNRSRLLLIVAGAIAGLAVIGVLAAVLLKGGSTGTTTSSTGAAQGSGSGSTTSRPATPPPVNPGVLDGKVVAAADVGINFSQFDNSSTLSQQTPCNVPVPVTKLAETDRSFSSQDADGNAVVVNVNLVQFSAGDSEKYLTALATAARGCTKYKTTNNGLDAQNTIATRGSGAQLGDGSVVRYTITTVLPSNLTAVEDVTAFRKGAVVAVIDEHRIAKGDAAATEQLAAVQGGKL